MTFIVFNLILATAILLISSLLLCGYTNQGRLLFEGGYSYFNPCAMHTYVHRHKHACTVYIRTCIRRTPPTVATILRAARISRYPPLLFKGRNYSMCGYTTRVNTVCQLHAYFKSTMLSLDHYFKQLANYNFFDKCRHTC